MSRRIVTLPFVFSICAMPALSHAQVPSELVSQGQIVDAEGAPLQGDHAIQFAVFDSAAVDGSEQLLWAEVQTLTFSGGYYTAILGQSTALDASIFDGSVRFLEVMVVAEGEPLLPRLPIHSVAYALRAGVAENAVGDITPNSVSVGGAVVINESGAWVGPSVSPDYAAAVTSGDLAAVCMSGSYNDLQNPPTTLTDIATSCADGDVPSFSGGNWLCVPQSTVSYSAGSGLTLAGDVFSADSSVLQARVVGTCSGGQMMVSVNEDGSVVCAADNDTTYSAGVGIDITGTTISLIDTVDNDTTYSAGTGIDITGTTISAGCPAGMAAIGRTCIHTETPYPTGLDWWTAMDTCLGEGLRLCSAEELVNGARAGILRQYAFATEGDFWYTSASQAEASLGQAGENTTCDVQANSDQPSHPQYSVQCQHDKSWTNAWRLTVCCY